MYMRACLLILLSSFALFADGFQVSESSLLRVEVPVCPLADGSLQIESKQGLPFVEWSREGHTETYQLLQQIVRKWEKDSLLFGNALAGQPFKWEVVPYQPEGSSFWKQFKVLWNITFGASCLSEKERQVKAEEFQGIKASLRKERAVTQDAFCQLEVIQRQLIFEGKTIYLLYNYAPLALGEAKLHFLLVPKGHCTEFHDLKLEEYVEAQELSKKLMQFYQNKGYSVAYLFSKNGLEAGQTVPHWHQHLVFVATKADDWLGKLSMLKNMLFGSSPLANEELKEHVDELKRELLPLLS